MEYSHLTVSAGSSGSVPIPLALRPQCPAFLRIDPPQKAISKPRGTTPIVGVAKSPLRLRLQGTELGYAGGVALDAARGQPASTLRNREGVLVLFGASTSQ